jgi:hypothetical protein
VAEQYKEKLVKSMAIYGGNWLKLNSRLQLTQGRRLGEDLPTPINLERVSSVIDLAVITARTVLTELSSENNEFDQVNFSSRFDDLFVMVTQDGLLNYLGTIKPNELLKVILMPDPRLVESNKLRVDGFNLVDELNSIEIYESVRLYLGFLLEEKGFEPEDMELKKLYMFFDKKAMEAGFQERFGNEFKDYIGYLYAEGSGVLTAHALQLESLNKTSYLRYLGPSFKKLADLYRITHPNLLKIESKSRVWRPEITTTTDTNALLGKILTGRDSRGFSFGSVPRAVEYASLPGIVDKNLALLIGASIQRITKSHWDKIASGMYI